MRFRIYVRFKFESTYQNSSNGRNDFFVVFLFWHRFVCLFIDILIDIFSMTSVRCFLFALELITKVPNDVLSILSSRLILDLDFFKDRDYVHSPKYVGASQRKKHAKNSSSTIPYGTFFAGKFLGKFLCKFLGEFHEIFHSAVVNQKSLFHSE